MTLREILDSMPNGSWLAGTAQLLGWQGRYSLSNQERKGLIEEVEKALETANASAATNLLYAGLTLDEALFLAKIQKKGLLRMSRYSYRDTTLVPVITALCDPTIGLSNATVAYFISLFNLYKIGRALRKEY